MISRERPAADGQWIRRLSRRLRRTAARISSRRRCRTADKKRWKREQKRSRGIGRSTIRTIAIGRPDQTIGSFHRNRERETQRTTDRSKLTLSTDRLPVADATYIRGIPPRGFPPPPLPRTASGRPPSNTAYVTFWQCVRASAVSGSARAGLRPRSAPRQARACESDPPEGTYPLLPAVTTVHRVFFHPRCSFCFLLFLPLSLSLYFSLFLARLLISRRLRALRRATFYRGF